MNIPFLNFELSSRMSSRVRKFRYNILFTFLMDGRRAPNGIGYLMMLFMAGGINHTHLCVHIHNHSFNFSGGVRSLGIA